MLKLLKVNYFLLTVLILSGLSSASIRRNQVCLDSSTHLTLDEENSSPDTTQYPQVNVDLHYIVQLPLITSIVTFSAVKSNELFRLIPMLLGSHHIALPPPVLDASAMLKLS